MHTFDTQELCCRTMLSWMPLEECMSSSLGSILPMSSNYTKDGDPCPPSYVDGGRYMSRDVVSITIPPNNAGGIVYRCKEGALSLFCNNFGPAWSRTSRDGTITHTVEDLGWERVGTCGEQGASSSNTQPPSSGRPTSSFPAVSPVIKPTGGRPTSPDVPPSPSPPTTTTSGGASPSTPTTSVVVVPYPTTPTSSGGTPPSTTSTSVPRRRRF